MIIASRAPLPIGYGPKCHPAPPDGCAAWVSPGDLRDFGGHTGGVTDQLPEGWHGRVYSFDDVWAGDDMSPADYARARSTAFNYYYKSFALGRWWGDDAGHPGRFVYQLHDCEDDSNVELPAVLDWSEAILTESTRKQLRVLVGREQGRVLEVRFQSVPQSGELKPLFTLKGDDSARFVDLIKSLDHLPVDGMEEGQRISGELIRQVLTDPASIARAYEHNPEVVAQLISSNVNAKDVIALANRKEQVAIFKSLLDDPKFLAARRDARRSALAVPRKCGRSSSNRIRGFSALGSAVSF